MEARTRHAENLLGELSLRSGPVRSRARPVAEHLSLQLLELTEYLFNTGKNQHFFCSHCGVRAFGVGNETPIGKMYGINVGCLEGVSEEQLSRIPITYVDGMNDRSNEAPTFSTHL